MTTTRARAAVDAWVSSATPALNTGRNPMLRLQGGTTVKRTFYHVKMPPKGAQIISSTLHFFSVGSSGDTYDITAQRVAAKWTESTIDYNNAPGVTGATTTVSHTESADAAEVALNVTAQVQAICDGAANYGFRLSITDTTERRLYSHDALDNHPYLETEWTDVPDAPTELSPAAGSAVTLAKPVLLFNFHDPIADSDLASVQVQIKSSAAGWTAAGGFASPDFDSLEVATSDPELDLSTTSYGGLSLAEVVYWTVRVKNQAGYWSEWSDVVHFTRLARGTLTIDSPTGGVVNDVSPTIIWELAGATQTGFRITVWNDADPGQGPLFDTGRRTSTATSFTLPWSVITEGEIESLVLDEDTVYRLRVRVWDDLTKVTTPVDTAHTEVVTTFSFVEDPTPDAPSSVAVSQVNSGRPFVALDIDIAVAPDSFTIVRNGKTIDTGVDPADIHTSGTIYRYVDRTAPPNRDLTYKVRSKDSGVVGPARTGSPNPYRYAVGEIWLLDWTNPGSSRMVPIWVNLDDCTFEMPENSAQYSPIDGPALVNITQGMKGLRGHIVGRVQRTAGLAAVDSVADFLWFKAHPTNQLRMTLGSQNLRVVTSNMLSGPLAIPDMDARVVEFDFKSQEGPTQ